MIPIRRSKSNTEKCPPLLETFGHGNPIEMVRALGEDATIEFLDDISPHLDALRNNEPEAADALVQYLNEVVVSANAIHQLGGLAAMKAAKTPSGDGLHVAPEEMGDLDAILAHHL